MRLKRTFKHLLTGGRAVAKTFPAHTLGAIERAIRESEMRHDGEIRFAVEAALDIAPLLGGVNARTRAIEVFSRLRIWDTENNNGVLIYVLIADHDFEIVADRGIDRRVGEARWKAICDDMENSFRQGDFEAGAIAGIKEVGAELERYFPASGRGRNELPDDPVFIKGQGS